jgi:hypothetical protein
MVLEAAMITRSASAQNATSSIYFPYPPDVVPPDLTPEKAKRVNREVSLIEAEALTQLHALPINSGTAIGKYKYWGSWSFSTGISRLTIFAAKNAGFVPRRTQRSMANGGRPESKFVARYRVRRP